MIDSIAWYASGAVVMGAVATIFRPDNKLCPVNLSGPARALLCVVLGAGAACLQNLAGGVPWQEAISTAVAAALTGWSLHALPAMKPSAAPNPPASGKGKDE